MVSRPGGFVVAFDPGETTGVCWIPQDAIVLERTRLKVDAAVFEFAEIRGHQAIWHILEQVQPHFIVSESFRLYASKATYKINSGFPEVEMIGVIRLWALLNNVPMEEQSASLAKSGAPNELLQRYGLLRHPSRHVLDAVRHMLVLYRRKGAQLNAASVTGRAKP